jgi:hypothetical protein
MKENNKNKKDFNNKFISQNNFGDNVNRKNKLPKKSKLFIIFGIIFLIIFGTLFYIDWERNSFNREQMKIHNAFIEYGEMLEEKMAKDDVGGSTPQETLNMFIEAVEKGDYELASDYFVIEEKEEILEELKKINRERILNVVSIFKKAQPSDYSSSLDFNNNSIDLFTMKAYEDDTIPFVIEFKKYPTDVWKILEI